MAVPTAHSRKISYEFIISLFMCVCLAQTVNVDIKVHMNFTVKCTQATASNICIYSIHVAFITWQIPKCNVNTNIRTNSISCVMITLAYMYVCMYACIYVCMYMCKCSGAAS